MQDSYVGDIGDYGKYGLLRKIAACQSIAVNWYRTVSPESRRQNDGRFTAYLDEPEKYRTYDPFVFDNLRRIVLTNPDRRLLRIEEAKLLPAVFFSKVIAADRAAWHREALTKTKGADAVFLDPDKGLETANMHRKNRYTHEHVRWKELKDYYSRGQDVILYQQLARKSKDECINELREFNEAYLQADCVKVLEFPRGTVRFFFLFLHLRSAETYGTICTDMQTGWQGLCAVRDSDVCTLRYAPEARSLGDNIRKLREGNGETQSELGRAVHVAPNTIAMYEGGKRQPDTETLQRIAFRYGYALDELVDSQILPLYRGLQNLTWEKLLSPEIFDTTFPLSSSSKALENPHFKQGLSLAGQITAALRQARPALPAALLTMTEAAFEAAFDSTQLPEAAANLLWMAFLRFALLPDKQWEAVGERMQQDHPDEVFSHALLLTPSGKENHAGRRAAAEEMHRLLIKRIAVLKASQEYAILGDYYLALHYILGMAVSDSSDAIHESFGIELMFALRELKNPYATAYLNRKI